jgi:hypothetical protein
MKFTLLISILFTTISFSQDLPESVYRNVTKEAFNSYYLDDDDKSFNAYDVGDNLNFDLEFNIDITLNQIREINEPQVLVEKSKIFAYTLISEISQSDSMKQMDEKDNYEKIILNFIYKTKDYKYIRYNFSIDVKVLRYLSYNMNKLGFYRILKRI